jgi:hypothetical protein
MRIRRALPALLSVLAVLICAAGEAQTGTVRISGTVVGLSSDQPVGDATVSIYARIFPDGRKSTTTDNQGRFVFGDLPAGRYMVGASKTGFVNVLHGQRRVGGAGRAIPVRDGESQHIRLQLPRTSVITGMIVDERGSPAVNASVRVLRFSMAYGYRRADTAGSGTTDDRGIYRIHSLQPGDYAVCASTRATRPLNETQRLRMEIDGQRRRAAYVLGPAGVQVQKDLAPRLAALEARLPARVEPVLGYAPTCHPGTGALPSMVSVAPEEERSGVDFQFALTRLARVEGIVSSVPDADPQIDPIMMINVDDSLSGSTESVRHDLDGRFTFTDVPPGRYRLLLRGTTGGTEPGGRLRADADVTVADDDIDNVVLQLQKPATVAGQVIFHGTPPPALSVVARVQIRIDPAVPGPLSVYSGTSPATPDESGRFVLANVSPGEYRISASSGEPIGWFMDEATIAGQDVLDQPLTVKPSESVTAVVVTLTNRRAELSGTIVNDQGEPAPEYFILVYPTDERFWTMRRIYGTRAKPDGKFAVTALRGGSYRVATLLDVEYGAWFDPSFLKQLESASMPLTIADGEKKTLNLHVPR